MTPTLIHFPIRRSTLPSVTRFSIISTSVPLTILSKYERMSISRTHPVAGYKSPVSLRPELDAVPVRAETRKSNRENPARRWRSADPPPPFARAYPRGPESRLVSVSHPLWEYTLGGVAEPDTGLL